MPTTRVIRSSNEKAETTIQTITNGALLWQVMCEFVSASNKLVPYGYSQTQAWDDVHDLAKLWSVIVPKMSVFSLTQQLLSQYSLSFWDALLVAACLDGGVKRLYSEDLTAYPRIQTLDFVNPFATASTP